MWSLCGILKMRASSIIVLSLGLVGCSAYQPDDLGAQTGYVTRLYPIGTTPVDYPECLVPLTDDQRAEGRYVEVRFDGRPTGRYVNSFVVEKVGLNVGDKVVIGSPYCVGSHRPEMIVQHLK